MNNNQFSISYFLNQVKYDLARTNRYMVEIALPEGIFLDGETARGITLDAIVGRSRLTNNKLNPNGVINLLCNNLQLPGYTIQTTEHKQLSTPYQMPTSGSFSNMTMTFYLLPTFNTHQFFKTWMDMVVNYEDNSINFHDEYATDFYIMIQDRKGNEAYKIKIQGAFPVELGAVQLAYGNNDQFASVDVTFTYSCWIIEPLSAYDP